MVINYLIQLDNNSTTESLLFIVVIHMLLYTIGNTDIDITESHKPPSVDLSWIPGQ